MSINTIRELLWNHATARVTYQDKWMYYDSETDGWIIMQRVHGKKDKLLGNVHTEQEAMEYITGEIH